MSIVGSLSKSQPHRNKLVTSPSWSELGTAQPQLVFLLFLENLYNTLYYTANLMLLLTTLDEKNYMVN